MASKENECAAGSLAAAPDNALGEVFKVEASFSGFRFGGIGGDEDTTVAGIVEGGVANFSFCAVPADFVAKII